MSFMTTLNIELEIKVSKRQAYKVSTCHNIFRNLYKIFQQLFVVTFSAFCFSLKKSRMIQCIMSENTGNNELLMKIDSSPSLDGSNDYR